MRKHSITGIAIMMMALAIIGCASDAAKVSAPVDGSYEGSAYGMQGTDQGPTGGRRCPDCLC